MAKFTITIDGVPIPVEGDDIVTRGDAVDAIRIELEANPKFIDEQRTIRLARPTEGETAGGRFAIGAGKFASDVKDATLIAASLMIGDDVSADARSLKALRGHAQFEKLRDLAQGTGQRPTIAVPRKQQLSAATVGEFVGENAVGVLAPAGGLLIAGGKSLLGLSVGMLKSFGGKAAGLMGGKKASGNFIEELIARGDIPAKDIFSLIASPTGKQVIKQMEKIENPATRKLFQDLLVDGKKAAEAGKTAVETGTREAADRAVAAAAVVRKSSEAFVLAQSRVTQRAARDLAKLKQARGTQQAAQALARRKAEDATRKVVRDKAVKETAVQSRREGAELGARQFRETLAESIRQGRGR